MDKVTLIRTVTHTMKNHNSAGYYALTGQPRRATTSGCGIRSSCSRLRQRGRQARPESRRHADVRLLSARDPRRLDHARPARQLPRQGARPALLREDPNSADFRLPELSLPERTAARSACIDAARCSNSSTGRRGSWTTRPRPAASTITTSGRSTCSPATRSARRSTCRPSRGGARPLRPDDYGQSCLSARRLVEAGVKFVTVISRTASAAGAPTSGGWDTHGFDNTRMYPIVEKYHLPITDHTLPRCWTTWTSGACWTRRSCLDGRVRPHAEDQRQRQPRPLAAVLHGALGRRRREAGAYIYGSSDGQRRCTPTSTPCEPDDLPATMYHL
jgi:hypothetical protein